MVAIKLSICLHANAAAATLSVKGLIGRERRRREADRLQHLAVFTRTGIPQDALQQDDATSRACVATIGRCARVT
jgi:hypothetical protein